MGSGEGEVRAGHLDTDSTMNTVYGEQMGARKGYNLRRKGEKSVQPLLSFVAETGECVRGKQHNGSSASGERDGRAHHGGDGERGRKSGRSGGTEDAGFYARKSWKRSRH